MCIRDRTKTDVSTVPTLVQLEFFTLVMAVDGTVETSVLVRNNGPLPNSPGMNFSNIDSGRVSLRSILVVNIILLNGRREKVP